jgi:hypothetical protein
MVLTQNGIMGTVYPYPSRREERPSKGRGRTQTLPRAPQEPCVAPVLRWCSDIISSPENPSDFVMCKSMWSETAKILTHILLN